MENIQGIKAGTDSLIEKLSNNSNLSSSNITSNTIETIDLGGFLQDVGSEVMNFFEDTGAAIAENVSSAWSGVTNWAADVNDWWNNEAFPTIKDVSNTINETVESAAATVGTVGVSLVEGVGEFGEAVIDFANIIGTVVTSVGTGLYDGGQAIYGLITGEGWESATARLWEGTQAAVAEEHVKSFFDDFYENNEFGQQLKEKSYGFDTVRSIGSGLGYTAGVVALTIATFGIGGAAVGGGSLVAAGAELATPMAFVAGAAGVGKGSQEAWANGADTLEGLASGTLNGVWEGLQFYVGGKIGGVNILESAGTSNQLLNSLARVALDGVDGGVEGFIQPLITALYKDGYIDENGNQISYDNFMEAYSNEFENNGGWSSVLTNAAMGSIGSLIGETTDFIKGNQFDVEGRISGNEEIGTSGVGNIEEDTPTVKLFDFSEEDIPTAKMDFTDQDTPTIKEIDAFKNNQSTVKDAEAKSKKLVQMTEDEIHESIKDEISQLNPNASNYAQQLAMLQQKEALEIELVKKMSGVADSGAAAKSIDLLEPANQQQAKVAAQEVYDRAIANETAVTASMQKLVDSDATLEGLDWKIKSIDSIEDKIARKVYEGYSVSGAQSSINDSLRYTLVVTGDYESTVLSKLKMLQGDGFEIIDMNNAWGGYTYQGLNVSLRNSKGVLVELQFHTPSSYNTKQVINHELYELSRNTSTSEEVRNISNRIQAINQRLYVGSDTTFQYKIPSQLRQAVDTYTPVKSYQELYNGMKKYGMDSIEASKKMAEDFGDAGDTVNYKLLNEEKTVQEVLNELTGNEKTAFIDFLNNTVEGKYIASLSNDELKAITRYTGGDYHTINTWLRTGNIPESEKAYIDTLNSALAKYGGLQEDTQLFRGVDIYAFTGQEAYSKIFDGIDKDNPNELYAALKAIEGREFTDAGYMSTSPSYNHSFANYDNKNIVLDIAAPKGTKGAYINQISKFYNVENEVLLAAGTKLKMVSVEAPQVINNQTKIVIKCEAIQ